MGHKEMQRNGVKWKMRHGIGAVLSLAGLILPLLVIAVCLPLVLPRLLGYEVYAITSGSMEPAISTGSAVYVKPIRAEEVAEGDANPREDMEARPYRSLIGKVELSLPKLGKVSLLLSNPYGKAARQYTDMEEENKEGEEAANRPGLMNGRNRNITRTIRSCGC